jgi:hypothetical protein
MAKKRVGSQIVNLTPNHYKSKIALISLCVSGVPHIVEKRSTKATTFLYASSPSKVCKKSYGPAKL